MTVDPGDDMCPGCDVCAVCQVPPGDSVDSPLRRLRAPSRWRGCDGQLLRYTRHVTSPPSLTPSLTTLDAGRCPLCGESNNCGVVAGRQECWCATATIPEAIVETIPAEYRGVACLCARCALGRAEGTAGTHTSDG